MPTGWLVLILPALVFAVLAIVWLFAGRQLVLLLDRVSTDRVESLPAGSFSYSPNGVTIGDYSLEATSPSGAPYDVRIDVDAGGRVVLRSAGGVFPLGGRIGLPDNSGRPDIAFAPDPGDTVTLTLDRSVLAWPTPFDLNFMTGVSPQRRRNLYLRLSWHKRSGAALDMAWRREQWFYARDGWSEGWMSQEGTTGLIDVRILAGQPADPETVEAYLARTKGWERGDYRLESRGLSADRCCEVVSVIHRLDESGAQPGGGRSMELYVDRVTHRIDREVGFQ